MTLYERYNTGDDTTQPNIYGATWIFQGFTIGATGANTTHQITSLKLLMYRTGLPGDVTVSIRAADAQGKPTGSDLATGTTDGNTLTTDTAGEWREIALTSYTLVAGTQYTWIFRVLDGDASNYINYRYDSSAPAYPGGAGGSSLNSGSTWTFYVPADGMFEEHGILVTPPAPKETYISGYLSRYQKRQMVGYFLVSGDLRSITCNASGHVHIASGAYVVADIAESGMGVQIQSGAHVQISGQHVFVESGVFVTTQPDIGVSGTIRSLISGDHVFVESGVHVGISGQHVYVESGVHVVSQSGTLYCITDGYTYLRDTSGNVMNVDRTVKAGITINTPHHEIHEGNMWHAWCRQSGLGDDSNLEMLIVTGSGKEIHLAPDGACGGDAWLEMYENVTVSSNGVLITPNCMHRTTSGTARTLTYCGPVVTSTMHPLSVQFMTGGQKQFAVGGLIRPNTEWIFDGVSGSINYLLRIVNVAGSAKDASIGVEFYEEDHNP